MGKEVVTVARWQGDVAEVKALLEAHEIILRGDIKARIARTAMTAVDVDGDDLLIRTHGGTLTLELGAQAAAKWADYLRTPLPTLAAKLGVGPDRRAFVIGTIDDAELAAALADATCATIDAAAVLIAILTSDAELASAHATACTAPHLHLWCVYAKGKSAPISDSAIRTFLRGNGYIDNKTTGVSDRLTATRYGARK
ncbi:MAG: hypothetical protein RLZZ58_806 [Pseudomonadota bacterium]